VTGTTHYSFTDYPVLLDTTPLGSLEPQAVRALFGTIGGLRIVDIEVTYLGAFFELWMNGDEKASKLFDGPPPQFPEVTFEP
jgi:hypothetical protein